MVNAVPAECHMSFCNFGRDVYGSSKYPWTSQFFKSPCSKKGLCDRLSADDICHS